MFRINLSQKVVKDLKLLKRKFKKIDDDIDELFLKLSQEVMIGNRLQEFGGLEIYKARVRNSSSSSGKSGGFRVIYYLKKSNNEIWVITIYSKETKTEIFKQEILKILQTENLI